MTRRKNIFLILCLLSFVLYYTLPTVFYYFRPLKEKISHQRAREVVDSIVDKVNGKRSDIDKRIQVTLKYLKIKPHNVAISKKSPRGEMELVFSDLNEAKKFVEILFQGEEAVSSKSDRLLIEDISCNEHGKTTVRVASPLLSGINREDFDFVSLDSEKSRAEREDYTLRKVTALVDILCRKDKDINCCGYFDLRLFSPVDVVKFSEAIVSYKKIFSDHLQEALGYLFNSPAQVGAFVSQANKLLIDEAFKNDEINRNQILKALGILDKVKPLFHKGLPVISDKVIPLGNRHPLFESVIWNKEEGRAKLVLKDLSVLKTEDPDLIGLIRNFKRKELRGIEQELGCSTEEKNGVIEILFIKSSDTSGLIVFKGARFLANQSRYLCSMLNDWWHPETFDLKWEYYPIVSESPESADPFGCYVFSPQKGCKHFCQGSLYVVAKGFNAVYEKYAQIDNLEKKELFYSDAGKFFDFFSRLGFSCVSCGEDRIFELANPLAVIADASGENFLFRKGSSDGILEVSDVSKRLAASNEIDSREHRDLLRWYNAHRHVRCSIDETMRLQVAVPHKNIFYNSLQLATKKYFRGAKALKWGMDIKGGKTVKLAFKDFTGNPVNSKEILGKISEELRSRLNHLGISEIQVRREGSYVNVDFPSSCDVPAAHLIRASAMSFHVVNEKFSLQGTLGQSVALFLRDVWKEVLKVTDNPSVSFINETAELLLNSDGAADYVQLLKNEGLRFSREATVTSAFDESLSAIFIDASSSQKQIPLVIAFKNHALEGSSLFDIGTSFDIKDGNVLHFSVKNSMVDKFGRKISPTDDFYKWTSKFSEEGIHGTERESYSSGRGWRMAVVVNDAVINMPTLDSPLRDSARITGNFSHEEASQLAADLKMGTMSFVPEIISEETVDPELGQTERYRSIAAALLGLLSVIVLMCAYYRFGGIVASGAVLLNLLIIWATLQYFEATLTISSLLGITLSMGMAVDANVLVFERIREEYLWSGDLRRSLDSGYKKAFKAILDSNVTTILAAGVLLFLETGPVRGFALTLIIGIFSSMFTALFLTKIFFDFWVQKTEKKEFKMMSKFVDTKVDFLSSCRKMWAISLTILIAGCIAFGFGAASSLPGMDFKGGFTFTLNLDGVSTQGRDGLDVQDIVKAFNAAGYSSRDFRVRLLNKAKKVKIYFNQPISDSILADTANLTTKKYAFQDIPWLEESVNILGQSGIRINDENLNDLHLNCSRVSGQFSSTMRNQAIYGMILALIGILIYIGLRFEWQYAVSAVIALLHDLVVTLSLLAAVHFFIKSLQFDLQAVGALITVLGYSLNNTIVIFDRIREIDKTNHSNNPAFLVNVALNGTLSRTVMTTATTLSVLLILLFLGGGAIFNFAFILLTGIVLGTLSSLYIAPPLLLYINGLVGRKRAIR